MDKFDTIDIFFIAIISAYFITLLCIIITIIYMGLSKLFKKLFSKKELSKTIEEPLISVTLETDIIKETAKEEPKVPKKSLWAKFVNLFLKKDKNPKAQEKSESVSPKETKEKETQEPKKVKTSKAKTTKEVKIKDNAKTTITKKKIDFAKNPLFRKLFMIEVTKKVTETVSEDKMDSAASLVKEENLAASKKVIKTNLETPKQKEPSAKTKSPKSTSKTSNSKSPSSKKSKKKKTNKNKSKSSNKSQHSKKSAKKKTNAKKKK